jgi:hypothetical protein
LKKIVITISIIILLTTGSFGTIGTKLENHKEDMKALIVGIADYPDKGDLRYTDDDAYDIREVLIKNGWNQNDITFLIDQNATKLNIYNELNNISSQTNPSSLSLFFFSGHGTQTSNGEAICCYDTVLYDMELNNIMNNFNGKVTIIIDACHSGGMIPDDKSEKIDFNRAEFTRKFVETIRGENNNRVILMACSAEEYSYEHYDLQNGIFSYYIINGLDGSANKNTDEIITAEETFYYAKDLATKKAQEYGVKMIPEIFDGNRNDNGVPIIRFKLPIPNLYCPGSLDFGVVTHGSTITKSFIVKNIGEPDSRLNWKVDFEKLPKWGLWTISPSSETGLKPEDSPKNVIIKVTVISRIVNYKGYLKISNIDNSSDYEEISLNLQTPKKMGYTILYLIFQKIIQKYTTLFEHLTKYF